MKENATQAEQGLVMIALGGSHRAIGKATSALSRAGIRQKWLGPTNTGSKRHYYAIPVADLARALALDVGIIKSRVQWDWLSTTEADSYFAEAG